MSSIAVDFTSIQTVYLVKAGSVSQEREWDQGGVEKHYSN